MAKRPCIENRTFDEISIGDEASLSRTLAWRDIEVLPPFGRVAETPHLVRNDSATTTARALVVYSRADKQKPFLVALKRAT
jgi:hypothetical protein